MKSSWSRPTPEGSHAPVEMRFIDMFMTALGALIFIALLLVFLLPKTAQTNQQNSKTQSSKPGSKDLDNKVLRRWLGVTLLTKGCGENEPALYVRWDSDLFNVETGEPLGKMEPFNVAAPPQQMLFGNKIFGLYAPAAAPAVLATGQLRVELLNATGLQLRAFYGVAAAGGAGNIYVALREPRSYDKSTCTIEPVYLSFEHNNAWKVPIVELKQGTPFAWLARFNLSDDGELHISAPDAAAHATFSDEQSDLLCKKRQVCDTRDAQLASSAASASDTSASGIDWRVGMVFDDYGYAVDMRSTKSECEQACLADTACAAIEFRDSPRYCARYRQVGTMRKSTEMQVGVKGVSRSENVGWKRDFFVETPKPVGTAKASDRDECGRLCVEDSKCVAVEYVKPEMLCNLFNSVPKVAASKQANSPRDVGMKDGRKDPRRLDAKKYSEQEAMPDPRDESIAFVLHDNYDIVGGDLRELKPTDQAACSSACKVNAACKAYSFDKWNDWCFLKKDVARFRLEPNTVSGLRTGVTKPEMLSDPPQIVRYNNKAFPYAGQDAMRAASIEECEGRCKSDPNCIAVTFFRKIKQCRQMTTTLEYETDPSADSSVKRQVESDVKAGSAR